MGKKVGPELTEMLNQGGAALQGYITRGKDVYKITDESAAKSKQYKDQMAELSARMDGVGVAIANRLLPGLNETAKAMNDAAQSGSLLKAVWAGLAGMSKVPWDLLMPPEDLKKSLESANRLKELQGELTQVEGYLKRTGGMGEGLIGKWLYGSPEELQQRATVLRNQIETLKKHGAELDKTVSTPAKPKTTPQAVTDLLGNNGQGTQILIALEKDYQNELAKRTFALNAPLLSASEKDLAESLMATHKRAQDSRLELEKQKTTIEASGKSFGDYQKRMDEITAAEEAQVAAITRLRMEQDKLNASWEYGAAVAVRKYIDSVGGAAQQTEKLVSTAFKSMEDSIASFLRTGTFDINAFKNAVLDMMAQIAAQKMLTGLMSLFGNGGSFGAINTPSKNEKGNVFGFANGGTFTNGIFASPTPFRFASGSGFNLGVMGEAGPEAVMPLTRGSDGKLGVKAQGGGNINITQIYNVETGVDQTKTERMMRGIAQESNAQLVDTLQRQGAL
jgi:lambda family phage tail tape measure protein